MTGNHVYGKLYRGFESLPLRNDDSRRFEDLLFCFARHSHVKDRWSRSDSDPESESEPDSETDSDSESELRFGIRICSEHIVANAQSPLCGLCIPVGAPFAPTDIEFNRVARLAVVTNAAPWVGMNNPQSSSILEHAINIAKLARPLVETIQRKDRDLASQVRRAVSSIALNAAEAQGNAGGNSRLRFESALGSLYEAQAGIRLAVAWGYVSDAPASHVVKSMHCLGGRVYGLTKR